MSMAACAAALLPARAMEVKSCEGVSLLPDDNNCLTQESAAGYRRVLAGLESRSRTIIVPAIGALSLPRAVALRRKAEAGCSVVLESALAFTDARTAERQCAVLSNVFGLHVASISDDLINDAVARVLYLRYRWPADVLVRQFGQPFAVGGSQCEPMAHWGRFPVAAKKPIGSGRLIFLGSPLGPMLMAQDREATLLVRQILSIC